MTTGDRSEIVRHVLTLLFGRGLIRASQFVSFVILARILSSADFGWYGIITTSISLASILGSLGLRQSFAYEIGQNRIAPSEALGTSIAVWIPLSLFSGGVVYLLYGSQIPGCSPNQAAGIIWVGVAAGILLVLIQGIYLGKGAIKALTFSEALPGLLLMVFCISIPVLGSLTLAWALWASVASLALTLPAAIWMVSKRTAGLAIRFGSFLRIARYGLLFALNFLLNALCSRISMFFIQDFLGPSSAGDFFAAVRVYEIFLEIATAFGLVLFSNAARQSEAGSVLKRNVRISCWMFWMFNVVGVIVWFGAPSIIYLIVGDGYATAGPALQILSLSLAPAAVSKTVYSTLAGSGNPAFGTPVIFGALVANILLSVSLVPSMGVMGGAVSFVVGQYVLFFGYVVICRWEYKVRVRDFFLPRVSDAKQILRAVRARSLQ